MMETHAHWPAIKGSQGGLSVESGIWQMLQDMRDGRFKVFSNLVEWFEEKRLYHRDDHGKIVKERDDLISATRYAYMMQRYAIPKAAAEKIRLHEGVGAVSALHDFDPYG